MKKYRWISLIVAGMFLSNVALADCDWSTGITQLPDGNYKYSKECHLKVGETVRDLSIANKQIENYQKIIELKDLALTKADERINLWMNTTYKLEDRVTKLDSLKATNQWLYFGLGAATVFAAGYMASKLITR